MRLKRQVLVLTLVLVLVVVISSAAAGAKENSSAKNDPTVEAQEVSQPKEASGVSSNVSVFASGLDNPRGLRFGTNGHLYVAEAGLGGSDSTVGTCEQVPFPLGPMTAGKTGCISEINPAGKRTTVADGLPSSETSDLTGNEILGVTDLAFVGKDLYALIQAGCSKGQKSAPNAVVRVNKDGTTTQIADLSRYYAENPTNFPPDEDQDLEGNPYSMVSLGEDLYVLEANHDELDKVGLDGTISRVSDIAAGVQGHITPTALTVGADGNFYMGNLSPVPYTDGSASLYKISSDGKIETFRSGLTTVLGVAFDCRGQLYALESSTGNTPQPPFLVPGSGKVLRLTDSGFETVASGLTFPTAMTFGPDGKLYVSNNAYAHGPAGGQGEIVKVDVGLDRNCKA